MGSGGDASISYSDASGQQDLRKALIPVLRGIGGYGAENAQMPNLGVPQLSGELSNIPLYDIPQYNTPQPTSGWFNSMSPEIMQGLYEPYNEAGRQMLELMGSRGQVGSAGSGYTGASGALLGELASQAGQQVGLNAWNMMAPYQMTANQGLFNANLQRNMMPYQAQQQEALLNFNNLNSAWGLPYQTMNTLYPYGIPGGIVQSGGSNPLSGMLSGMISGAGAGAAAGSFFPGYGTAIGAVGGGLIGGLGGYMGSKPQ